MTERFIVDLLLALRDCYPIPWMNFISSFAYVQVAHAVNLQTAIINSVLLRS